MSRNLDGCYFRIERDGKWQNICFSDLTQTERERVMDGKDAEWLKVSLSPSCRPTHDDWVTVWYRCGWTE